MSYKNAYDYIISAFSITWGLANIQEILGIILLVLTILNILYKMIYSLYTKIKNKEYDKIGSVFDNTIKEIENIKEKEENNNGNK